MGIRTKLNPLGNSYTIDESDNKFACSDSTVWFITEEGDLYGCGLNDCGQQGSGNTTDVNTFIRRATNVEAVFCSDKTTWYLTKNGDLYGCGLNNSGQQGNGDTTNVLTFTKRAENVVKVCCISSATWYINYDRELYGCGNSLYGQQGSGNTTNVTMFTKRAENVVKVCCKDDYDSSIDYSVTWYLTDNQELYGCGSNRYGQQGKGIVQNSSDCVYSFTKRAENVVDFSCSHLTTLYIDINNDLYGCGSNHTCQLKHYRDTYPRITSFTKLDSNIKKVFADRNETQIITNDDALYVYTYRSLVYGDNSTTDYEVVLVAENVSTVSGQYGYIREVDGTISHTSRQPIFYINLNNELYGLGNNDYGQQGSGDTTKVESFIKRGNNVKNVYTGSSVTYYTTLDNKLFGCGSDNVGQQGNYDTSSSDILTFENKLPYFSATILPSNNSTYLKTGKYFIELVGAGAGLAQAISYGSGNTTGRQGACAISGGSSGAAFVGELNLLSGNYTLTQGIAIEEQKVTAVSKNETETVQAIVATEQNASVLYKDDNVLISAGGASRGSAWACYSTEPYYDGSAGSGGVLNITNNSIIGTNVNVNSNGNSGTFGGTRNTSSWSGSLSPSYTTGASVYNSKGAAGSDGYALLTYKPYAE